MDLREAENIKKRQQEYTELYKKDLHDPGNHDRVISHVERDILECKVKWVLGSITANKASGGDGIPVEPFQILRNDSLKVLNSIYQHIWKTQQWPQDWKISVFIPIPKKGNATECSKYHTIALISYASNAPNSPSRASIVHDESQDVQAGFRKDRGTRDQIATSVGSLKKQEHSRKTSISVLLTRTKPLTVWTTANSGKF